MRSRRKQDKRPVKLCKNYTAQLEQAFGIVVDPMSDGILFSKTMCMNCYNKIRNILNKNKKGSVNSALADIEKCKNLWQPYDSFLSIFDCPTCSQSDILSSGGNKRFSQPLEKTTTDDTSIDSVENGNKDSFSPPCFSTPIATPASASMSQSDDELEDSAPMTPTNEHEPFNIDTPHLSPLKEDVAKQSKNKSNVTAAVRPFDQISLPLTPSEEKLFTKIAKLKLEASKNKRLILCKSKSQPIALWKFVKPRQRSKIARTPLKKKRATEVRKFRDAMSGDSLEDAIKQQSSELKTEKKKVARNILDSAGFGKQKMTAKEMVRLQGKLGISNTAQRTLRSVFRRKGIKVSTEKEERQFKMDALCSTVKINKKKVYFYNDNKPVKREIPVAEVENIPEFVTNSIDKLNDKVRNSIISYIMFISLAILSLK